MSKNITRLALLAALSLAVTSPLSAQNNKVEAQTRTQSGLPKIKMNLSKKGSFSMGAAGAPQAHIKNAPNKYGEALSATDADIQQTVCVSVLHFPARRRKLQL